MFSGSSQQTFRIALLIGVSGFAGSTRAERYAVVDLGPITGEMSGAASINASGHAAGFSSSADPAKNIAAFWTPVPQPVGVLPGDGQAIGFVVSPADEVFGVSYNFGDLGVTAFSWQAGLMTPLDEFFLRAAAGPLSAGFVSQVQPSLGLVNRAVVRVSGFLVPLGTLGGSDSHAYGVNAAGDVVGVSSLADEITERAFLYRAAQMRDLGTLGGAGSQAYAINDIGQVVGVSDTVDAQTRGFLFKVDALGNVTARISLGTPDNESGFSYAHAINNSGTIVGTSNDQAMRWREYSDQVWVGVPLNRLIFAGTGWRLISATAVNEQGQIVGSGMRNGQLHGFRLDPTSEADFDSDYDVDMDDFAVLQRAYYAWPGDPYYGSPDLNGDGQADKQDVTLFRSCATGSAILSDPACPSW